LWSLIACSRAARDPMRVALGQGGRSATLQVRWTMAKVPSAQSNTTSPYDASADEDPEQGHHDHPRVRTAFHVAETTGLQERAPAALHRSIIPTRRAAGDVPAMCPFLCRELIGSSARSRGSRPDSPLVQHNGGHRRYCRRQNGSSRDRCHPEVDPPLDLRPVAALRDRSEEIRGQGDRGYSNPATNVEADAVGDASPAKSTRH